MKVNLVSATARLSASDELFLATEFSVPSSAREYKQLVALPEGESPFGKKVEEAAVMIESAILELAEYCKNSESISTLSPHAEEHFRTLANMVVGFLFDTSSQNEAVRKGMLAKYNARMPNAEESEKYKALVKTTEGETVTKELTV